MKTKFYILLLFLFVFSSSHSQQKLIHSDRIAYDYFGATIGVFGNYLIISADGQDTDENGENPISDAGAAYLFEKDSNGEWIQKQKITAFDRKEYVLYGFLGLSINENYILIGARYADNFDGNGNAINEAGAAYLYQKNSSGDFVEVQKLSASDITEYSLFGKHVKLSDNYCLVSAPSAWCEAVGTQPYSTAGAVYLFERNSSGIWEEKQKLMSSDRATGDNFGESVGVYENYIVIGAYSEDEDENGSNTINNAGSAYIFEKDSDGNWTEVQKIVAPDRSGEDIFGARVDMFENTLVITALSNDTDENFSDPITNAGAVYVYERDGAGVWNFKQKLVPSDRENIMEFGASVKVNENYIIASNYYEQNGSTTSSYGSVYIFQKDASGNWVEIKKITAPDGNNGDMFGYFVSISNEHIAMGSPYHDKDLNGSSHKSNAGAAYIYNISELLSTKDVSTTLEMTRIYPNPNTGSFTIAFGKQLNNANIKVTGVLGKTVYSSQASGDKLNIQLDEAKGIYFVSVQTEQGERATLKLVVE